ncbi:MAG: HAD family hydrolase [Pseudopedobacter saltans]|uniref:HAD family hydrolase n=1 Tax=Pseudopedobacter saltans TaxID=151895 RepID=A0A2W5ERE3_9SPHI|nr:MAG: HAD family hydrolase [Pseudopedobacter saltans]
MLDTLRSKFLLIQTIRMPDIRLIATDMDGTLLNSAHKLPNDFYQIFEQLCEKNILFVAASGRQYYNLLNVFEKIADRMSFIAENGTYVVHKGKEIASSLISPETVLRVIDIVMQIPNTGIVVCGKNCAYYQTEEPEFVYTVGLYYGRKQKVNNIKEHVSDCLKIAVFCGNGTEENVYPHVKQLLEQDLQVVVSGKVWLDMMPKGANKGEALKKLQQALDITSEQTLVFGDYMNDIEMLQDAKYSYAMKNAHPIVQKVANYVTHYSNDEEGVTKEIKKLVL